METGERPNDAPLPEFLADDVTRRALADARNESASPRQDSGDRPPRVVTLPIGPTPTGEAALAGLPVTALTKRRVGWLVAAVVTVWVLALFMRQVGDASAAQSRADQIRLDNATLAAEVEALALEKELVQQEAYLAFEARAYGFGEQRERRFVLAPGAPSLAPDAPGSSALRVGRVGETRTPLESWLEILFGPAR